MEKERKPSMHLTDLLPLDAWVEIEKDIHQRLGLDVSVFDTRGYRITGYKAWANRLCPAIKATDKGQSFICAVAHMNVASQAQQTRKPVIEECDAGLVKALVPIFVGEEYVGALCGCGMLLDDGEVETFLVNKITGIDEQVLEELAGDIPTMTSERLEAAVALMSDAIDKVVSAYQKRDREKKHP